MPGVIIILNQYNNFGSHNNMNEAGANSFAIISHSLHKTNLNSKHSNMFRIKIEKHQIFQTESRVGPAWIQLGLVGTSWA